MFETMTTNGATILTLVLIWGTLAWALTYMYMTEKIRRKDEVIRFLDIYIEEDQTYIDMLRGHIEETERQFGHVIDDYIDHYYSDGEWVKA